MATRSDRNTLANVAWLLAGFLLMLFLEAMQGQYLPGRYDPLDVVLIVIGFIFSIAVSRYVEIKNEQNNF